MFMRVLREPYSYCDHQWDFTGMGCATRSLVLGKRTTERIMIHADLDKFDRGGRARALPILEVDMGPATHGPCLSSQGSIAVQKRNKMILG
jgi:hypothetical protein